jgi:hypothetical protein
MSKTLYVTGEERGGGLHTVRRTHENLQPAQSTLSLQESPHCPPSLSRTRASTFSGAGVKGEEATSTVKAEAKSKAESFILRFKTDILLRLGFL